MTIHEIITSFVIIATLSYALGRFDEKRDPDDCTIGVALFFFCLAVLSATVAITLRLT